MLRKVNKFIERVRDNDLSSVLDSYLQTAIYVMSLSLKATPVKKENHDQSLTP